MMWRWLVLCLAAFQLVPAHARDAVPEAAAIYDVRHDRWSAADEAGWRKFVAAIGESDCDTVDACLHSPANPYRDTDPPDWHFRSDCADLPYILRFYFAWKNGLPFSYVAAVAPHDDAGHVRDIRYTRDGNRVTERIDVPSGVERGYEIMEELRHAVSSATYRIHPDLEAPLEQDFYSPAIDPKSILPGTIIYDPAGHLAIVYRIDPNGRIFFFDAHTDYSLTQMFYDLRFARERPSVGAGFKNWRPIRLVGATRRADGVLVGGHIELATNAEIPDFSDEQYYGNGRRPDDENWRQGTFAAGGETLDYYDFVRARMAGGRLRFDPLVEIRDMTRSICADLHYRALAVDVAVRAGVVTRPEPARLPDNIYGTEGDWETYSSPSRDARLKTAFVEVLNAAKRFIAMWKSGDSKHLIYTGSNLPRDLLRAYDEDAAMCHVAYRRTDGSIVTLRYEQARERLFAMSFDPYHCPERRWGATDAAELSTCPDGPVKRAWYRAEQTLRNQIDRTYDARMDYSLCDLEHGGETIGAAASPDTDVHAYLAEQAADAPSQPRSASAP